MPTPRRPDRALMTPAAYQQRATEAQMQDAVGELVTLRGGRFFHLEDARKAPELEDLPDWLILLPPTVYLMEAKSQRRPTTLGQRSVLALLAECPRAVSGIVRPVPRTPEEIAFDHLLALLERG